MDIIEGLEKDLEKLKRKKQNTDTKLLQLTAEGRQQYALDRDVTKK